MFRGFKARCVAAGASTCAHARACTYRTAGMRSLSGSALLLGHASRNSWCQRSAPERQVTVTTPRRPTNNRVANQESTKGTAQPGGFGGCSHGTCGASVAMPRFDNTFGSPPSASYAAARRRSSRSAMQSRSTSAMPLMGDDEEDVAKAGIWSSVANLVSWVQGVVVGPQGLWDRVCTAYSRHSDVSSHMHTFTGAHCSAACCVVSSCLHAVACLLTDAVATDQQHRRRWAVEHGVVLEGRHTAAGRGGTHGHVCLQRVFIHTVGPLLRVRGSQ